METIINKILTHKNLFHKSTTITPNHLLNNYLKNHLISINNLQNLKCILNKLNTKN